MNEKKKLLAGIGAAVIIAAVLAWFTSFDYSGRKGKKAVEQIMGAVTTKEYNLKNKILLKTVRNLSISGSLFCLSIN